MTQSTILSHNLLGPLIEASTALEPEEDRIREHRAE